MPILSALLLVAASAVPAPGTLAGRVTDDAGSPLAGAVVDLYTARPRIGLPTMCLSRYRDCAKQALTDGDGRFSIADLDPLLQFRVLVTSPGRRPVLTELVDPAAGNLALKLEPMPAGLPDDRMLRGRVVDDNGKPIAGAVVSPIGAKTREKRLWGALPGVDEAAVADAQGRFAITSRDPMLALDLEATAPGYAIFRSQLFELDGREREIRMRRGADVAGRLIYQGKPATGRAIGLVQKYRSTGYFAGETTLASDDEGAFCWVNLQPNERYALYTLCDGKSDLPVLTTVSLHTGGDGAVTKLGNLMLIDGLTLAGRVELPEGAAMPPQAKLRISRDPPWDWCEIPLAGQGIFKVRGLPPEVCIARVVATGFEIDASRLNFQAIGASQFALRLREDRRDLVVPLKAKSKKSSPAR